MSTSRKPGQRKIATAVRDAMRADQCQATRVGEDVWRVEVLRGGARLKFDLHPGSHVDCVHLASDTKGWLEDANRLVTEVLGPEFGVQYVEMSPNTDEARDTFTKHAPYEHVEGTTYRWTL